MSLDREDITSVDPDPALGSVLGALMAGASDGTLLAANDPGLAAQPHRDSSSSRHRATVALRSDGTPYPGSLLHDILDYRALRSRRVRGTLVQPEQRVSLRELHDRLTEGSDPSDGSRVPDFARFSCGLLAWLGVSAGPCWPCSVYVLSVEGAHVRCLDATLRDGDLVRLLLDRYDRALGDGTELACRVEAHEADQLVLSFTGVARTAHGRYAFERGPFARSFICPDRVPREPR